MPSRAFVFLCLTAAFVPAASAASGAPPISVRTEQYPRPPYSGAVYYIYAQGGSTICTKLEVCNKFDECQTSYHRGSFRDDYDRRTGDPYGTSPAVIIAPDKLKKHVCLVRYQLIGSP